MSKKIISFILSLMAITSLTGCTSAGQNTESNTKATLEESIDNNKLEGEWAKDYTLEETQKLFKDKLSKMESITKELGVKYKKEEVVKEEKEQTVNDNSIYFDNEKPEANKIESMYFGMKTYGEELETGDITLKVSLNFDGETAISKNDFDLGKTSFNKYIVAFTGEENRDYSDINKEIISKLKSAEKEVEINNTIDGLKEEIIATKECIIYKLSTKKYKFSDAEMSME